MPDKGFHWAHKGGYISKLEVQSDGTLKMVNESLSDLAGWGALAYELADRGEVLTGPRGAVAGWWFGHM